MRNLSLIALLTLNATGCGRGGMDQATEIDALKRRATSLERRVGQLEGNGPRPAKSEEAEPPAEANVSLTGDAVRAVLVHEKKRFPIPSYVPPGTYDVLATFAAGEPPATVGSVTVPEQGMVEVSCASATSTCAAR